VLTNLEVLSHLKTLQSEIDTVTISRGHNISRQIHRQRGLKGLPDDVPTYEDEAEAEKVRLQSLRDAEVTDKIRAREEKRRVRQEAVDKENEEILRIWEDETKKANANKKPRQKKITLPKPTLKELSPEPEMAAVETDAVKFHQTDEEATKEAKESLVLKEQFQAVRPMSDELRYVTSSVRIKNLETSRSSYQ
jgi:hypothetical protein